ncbi:DNA-processing protein DprA [Gilvimarinus sp. DA14]|uniref:DNA-processing protein DprA n=1 Tax=Gilvimarinus sp. DA14 TaxID=2956798 RepID=UPI0020B6F627|nr:DNA-processing protein DprA [Gilvimarinus sp. DA14]UTF59099.1 DNA-processing protein DprA [Gilvimarinus sp. DA14]
MQAFTPAFLLSRVRGLGPSKIKQLYSQFGSLQSVLNTSAERLEQCLSADICRQIKALQNRDSEEHWRAAEDLACWLEQHPEVSLLSLDDEDYPALLADTPAPPPLLYVRGNLNALELPQLAVVGSRNPTAGGSKTAFEFSRCLASGGFAITSGLALGVDACAHRGALAGDGITLAVMGTGIDRLYPARNRALAEEIVAGGGALVTEFAPGTASEAANFPRRNRIISGLSLGTMVVEAAVKSGSLITARYAVEHQREVFAVPGSINNPLSRGCHALIKNGAKLVECADDIIAELNGALAYKHEQLAAQAPTEAEHWLLGFMGYDPVTLDHLCERSGKNAGELAAALLDLELEGVVAQRGSYYSRL